MRGIICGYCYCCCDRKYYSLHNTEPIAPSRSSAPVQAHDVSESCPLGVILSLHMAGSVPSGMTKATERSAMASVTPIVR